MEENKRPMRYFKDDAELMRRYNYFTSQQNAKKNKARAARKIQRQNKRKGRKHV